jgi:RNA-binding protein
MSLSAKQRQALRAAAHHLKPVILIGQKGITEPLVRETDAALKAHELIKVQIQEDDRAARREGALALAEATASTLVHQIGKTFVLYRPKSEDRP